MQLDKESNYCVWFRVSEVAALRDLLASFLKLARGLGARGGELRVGLSEAAHLVAETLQFFWSKWSVWIRREFVPTNRNSNLMNSKGEPSEYISLSKLKTSQIMS